MTDKKKSSVNRRILQIAIPSIISNITVPLLGLIDVTIVGHLGSPAYIGAIAVGGMLFNISQAASVGNRCLCRIFRVPAQDIAALFR